MIAYELWETDSGNLMASFATEAQALAVVADRVAKFGSASVDSVALVVVNDSDEDGDVETIAEGADLARRSVSVSARVSGGAATSRRTSGRPDAMPKGA